MWKLFQIAVGLSVAFTGIYYEWTPNGYVLGLLSVGAAFFATLILSWAFKTARGLFSKQGLNHGLPRRR